MVIDKVSRRNGRSLMYFIQLVFFFAVATLLGAANISRSEEAVAHTRETFRDCFDCPEMVTIPAGSFLMGSSVEEAERDLEFVEPKGETKTARQAMRAEYPQRQVNIERPFAISKYPVTRIEFANFVSQTGYPVETGCTVWVDHTVSLQPDADWKNPGFQQTDMNPVVCVNRQDIEAYLLWLNGKLRERSANIVSAYRLPSEAEWEYSARGNTRTARWWGNRIGFAKANCDGCGSRWDKKTTSPVNSFPVNPFGLGDVLGNIWQSVEDCWSDTYVGAPVDGSARSAENCQMRVMRGGAWFNHPWVIRSANRSYDEPLDRSNHIGFRVAKSIP
jgi:formylglycine-generating enzyme required for sulfatase activity